MGQELTRALIRPYKRIGATTAYAALVGTGNQGEVTLPAAANADNFMGFELQAQADQDVASAHVSGGIALAVAAAAFAPGARLVIADNTGRVKAALDTSAPQLDAGLVPAANLATLTKTAKQLVAVNSKTGTLTGPLKILPKGSAVITGQAALNAGGTGVVLAAADGVTSVDIEYDIAAQRVVAVAEDAATNAGDIVGVKPIPAGPLG